MPRMKRVVVPNYPHHVIQRGHNQQVVFGTDDDCLYYLANLRKWKHEFDVKVYAYCLMPNHVHLILNPGEDTTSLARFMKRIGAKQTRFRNRREARSGTIWNGKYKSSLIDTNRYLLACCRYVELNPVRAGIVNSPGNYRWSSYRSKTGMNCDVLLDEDPLFRSLGNTPRERQNRYRRWLEMSVPENETKIIRLAVRRGQLTGDENTIEMVRDKTGRRIEFRGQGRPEKINRTPFLL